MAKQKKKRNKVYSGSDARVTRPQVVRISAEQRSAPKQWWIDHKRMVRPVAIVGGIVLVIGLLISGVVTIITGFSS